MPQQLDRRGLALGASAYAIWGFFPILMAALKPAGAWEILAHRMLWSLAVCLIVVAIMNRWSQLREVWRDKRTFLKLVAAAGLISVNWAVMVYAVMTDNVGSTALGYYINPLLTVALGVVFLRERLRRAQIVAISLATVAVIIIGVEVGGFPWIALSLAFSFGIYSFIKKSVGPKVDALTGLTIETAVLVPVAVGLLIWINASGKQTFLDRGTEGLGVWHDIMMIGTGVWTAGALILFAAGAALLPLNITGLLQYIAPTLQFIFAVTYFHEPMPAARWVGFALVWVALVVLTVDGWRNRGRASATRERVPVAEPV